MPSSTYIKRNKNPHEMTLDELRAACEANETAFYRDRAEAEPDNAQAQDDYRQHCLLKGLDPSTGKPSRFATMTKEEIGQEWEVAGKKQEATELETYRDRQAQIFLASQPKYIPTQENSDKIIQELERQKLRGSVYDINNVFLSLVERGEIEPKFVPELDAVPLHSREEMYDLSTEELKRLAEQTNK